MAKSSVITLNMRISFQRGRNPPLSLSDRRTGERRCKTRRRPFLHSLVKKMAIPFSLSQLENCWPLVWFLEFPPEKLCGTHSRKQQQQPFMYLLWFLSQKTEITVGLDDIYKPGTRQHLKIQEGWLKNEIKKLFQLNRSHGFYVSF